MEVQIRFKAAIQQGVYKNQYLFHTSFDKIFFTTKKIAYISLENFTAIAYFNKYFSVYIKMAWNEMKTKYFINILQKIKIKN